MREELMTTKTHAQADEEVQEKKAIYGGPELYLDDLLDLFINLLRAFVESLAQEE